MLPLYVVGTVDVSHWDGVRFIIPNSLVNFSISMFVTVLREDPETLQIKRYTVTHETNSLSGTQKK